MFILKVVRTLEKHSIPYAIVGGHAVNLHGAVRGTIDIDFVIKWTKETLINCEKALSEIGLFSRNPINAEQVYRFKDEYIKEKNMIAWNFINPSDLTEQVDIIITFPLKSQKVVNKRIKGVDVKILAKDDLIKMKKKSGRQQDLIDIEALEKL